MSLHCVRMAQLPGRCCSGAAPTCGYMSSVLQPPQVTWLCGPGAMPPAIEQQAEQQPQLAPKVVLLRASLACPPAAAEPAARTALHAHGWR